MFVTKKVFDPSLSGKAARVVGHDVDGDAYNVTVLIAGVDGERLNAIDIAGKRFPIHMENFEKGGLKLILLEEPKATEKKRIRIEGQKKRTQEQITNDERVLISYLDRKQKPVKLDAIIRAMQTAGCKHWNTKNGSAFIKHAIKYGAPIKKTEYGVYIHKKYWEGGFSLV